MTSFAPGTNKDYANAYNNWWFNQNGQGQAPKRSAFGPDSPPTMGQAQPIQPQSQGTPYGQQPPKQSGAFSAYAPQQQGGSFSAWQQQPSFTPGGGMGHYAYSQPSQRPQPFTQSTYDFTGQQSDPSQLFAQRDAFVQSINDARAPFAQAAGAGYAGPPPQRDMQALWNQAGDMAQGGFQNPFAPEPRYVPAEQRDGKRWSDSHYVYEGPLMQTPAPQSGAGRSEVMPPAPGSYQEFLQNYNSGAPLGNRIWETRRSMGQGAPGEGFWQGVNNPPPMPTAKPAAAAPYVDAGLAAKRDYQRQWALGQLPAPSRPALPPAFSGKESSAQQAMRGQILHSIQRDASMNSWQFKNMTPEAKAAEIKRRQAEIMAAPPKEIERMHREGRFPGISKQSQAGYKGAVARYER